MKKLGSLLCAAALFTCASPTKGLTEGTSLLDSMISPVTNPVNFEDPRPNTEAQPVFMYHKLSKDFVTGAGNVRVAALQLRYAVNERLAIIATKDGYIDLNPEINLPDQEGAANIAAGLKYAFYRDDAKGDIATAGLRYELASGSPEVFQGQGDGAFNIFLSGASNLDTVNAMAFTQLRVPVDSDDSTFWDLSLHADYPINDFYPLVEVNMIHIVDAGSRIPLDGEGFDLISFGSSESDGSTVVTAAVGARYRVCDSLDIGAAYEFALTDREDLFDWRVTTDMIISLDKLFS